VLGTSWFVLHVADVRWAKWKSRFVTFDSLSPSKIRAQPHKQKMFLPITETCVLETFFVCLMLRRYLCISEMLMTWIFCGFVYVSCYRYVVCVNLKHLFWDNYMNTIRPRNSDFSLFKYRYQIVTDLPYGKLSTRKINMSGFKLEKASVSFQGLQLHKVYNPWSNECKIPSWKLFPALFYL
jgi:hypothetical protein